MAIWASAVMFSVFTVLADEQHQLKSCSPKISCVPATQKELEGVRQVTFLFVSITEANITDHALSNLKL